MTTQTKSQRLANVADKVVAASMRCEDCNGEGHVGEEYRSSDHFQPPERDVCTSCNGSGSWHFDALPVEAIAQLQAHILAQDAALTAAREALEAVRPADSLSAARLRLAINIIKEVQ
jgi:RecJ-like exonuclease